jgi:hypothetical protein
MLMLVISSFGIYPPDKFKTGIQEYYSIHSVDKKGLDSDRLIEILSCGENFDHDADFHNLGDGESVSREPV